MSKKIIFISIIFSLYLIVSACSDKKQQYTVNIDIEDDEYYGVITKEELIENRVTDVDKDMISENSIGFLKEDGSKILYVFSQNIFYKDGDKMFLIDDRLCENKNDYTERGYLYTVKGNDIKSYYNKDFSGSEGIIVEYAADSFMIKSQNNKKTEGICQKKENIIGEEKNMIVYKNVFANNSDMRVYPNFLGTSIEINTRDNSKHKFTVRVELNDKYEYLKKEPGGYIVVLNEFTDEVDPVGIIHVPIVRDKEGEIYCSNNINISKVTDQKYNITFEIEDKIDLTDSIIYSSFEFYRSKQPDNAIYSKKSDLTYNHLNNCSVLGQTSEYGIGRLMLRFLITEKFDLPAEDLESVTYKVKSLGERQELEMHVLNEDWCSVTGNWDSNYNVGDCISKSSYEKGYISFNITEIMKRWCEDNEGRLEHNGVQIKLVDEENKKLFLLSNDSVLYIARTIIQIK